MAAKGPAVTGYTSVRVGALCAEYCDLCSAPKHKVLSLSPLCLATNCDPARVGLMTKAVKNKAKQCNVLRPRCLQVRHIKATLGPKSQQSITLLQGSLPLSEGVSQCKDRLNRSKMTREDGSALTVTSVCDVFGLGIVRSLQLIQVTVSILSAQSHPANCAGSF